MKNFAKPFAIFGTGGLFLLSIFLVGCGDGRPKRVPVSGRVTIDGQPLKFGSIRVLPANDRAAAAAIGPDGRFQLTTFDKDDGCVLGKHPVTVTGNEDKGPTAILWHAPKKYADPQNSGLMLDVTGPTDNVEIKLTWDGGKPFLERSAEGEEGMPRARKMKQ